MSDDKPNTAAVDRNLMRDQLMRVALDYEAEAVFFSSDYR